MWDKVRARRRRAQCTHSVQERARLLIGIRAGGGVHLEHEGHVCDFGGVKAERLVERRRVLRRVEWRVYDAGLLTGGGGRPRRTPRAGQQIGGRAWAKRTLNM